jgi:hypothetical protein
MTTLPNPAQKLWQDQPVEGITMSAEVIHQRATKLERTIRRRNLREYVASLFAAALLGYFCVTAHDLLSRITFGLFIAAMIWIVVQLHRKGSATSLPPGVDTLTSLRLYRAELVRQHAVVKNIWWWYLAPMVPGFVVFTIGLAIKDHRLAAWAKLAVMDVMVTGLFFWVWKLNMKAARCLERSINAVDAAELK